MSETATHPSGGTNITKPSIARSTASMSIATLVSRITGLARDWSIAVAMGVSLVSSAYTVSNNIPNMIYELVAGGVLSAVFIPMFIEKMENDGEERAWRFASSVFNVSVLALGLVAVLGTVFAELFVRTQTIRVPPEQADAFIGLGTFFFRFFAIQVVIYGAHAIVTGVLNSYRKFTAAAVAPIFNNLVLIAVILGVYMPLQDSNPQLAQTMLAIGTTLGVLAMLLTLLPSLLKVGIRYTPTIDWHDPALHAMGRKMLATVIYVVTNLVGVSLRNAYSLRAASEGVGPAAVRYAWMFYQLPYGVFAVALATAFMPELSSAVGARDTARFKRQFMSGLSATGLLMLPAAAMLIALAEPLVTLLRAGQFTASDVPLVAGVLRYWALGVFSFAAYMFTLRAFYALQDTRTPMFTNIVSQAILIALYSVLTLGIAGWPGIGLPGIAAADAIAYTLHFIALMLILRRRVGAMNARAFLKSVGSVLLASIAGGTVSWLLAGAIGPALAGVPLGFVIVLIVAALAGLGTIFGLAALLRVPELEVARSLVARATGRRRKGGTQ